MLDVVLVRYVRMCTLLHVMCQIWDRCVRCVACIREPKRRTESMGLFCSVLETIGSALSRAGRLARPKELKRAVVMARFVGWDSSVEPPQDMARSIKGRTALMVMAFDQVFGLWDAMPKHSKDGTVEQFGDFVTTARHCFRGDGRILERVEDLDTLLARHYALVVAVAER